MLKTIGMIALGVFMFFCGAAMIEMALTEPDFEIASRIFASVCGLILALGGGVVAYLYGSETFGVKGAVKGLKSDVSPNFHEVTKDECDTEKLIRRFRLHYDGFFSEASGQNPVIAGDVTQIFLHILGLQKKRLEKKGVSVRLESKRMSYGVTPVSQHRSFDGRYRINNVTETVEAKKTFFAGKRKLTSFRVLDTARYRLLSASTVGESDVICPSCGAAQSRDSLLDGCDFCGTKFTVEDLGTRVSDFGLRPDYEIEYERWKGSREAYFRRAGLIVGVPIFIFCMAGALMAAGDLEAGFVMKIAATMFAAAFPTAAFTFFAMIPVMLFIFPAMQTAASLRYRTKKQLASMKAKEASDLSAESKVKAFDRNFSLGGFMSGVQNMLAASHFADTPNEIIAFAEGQQAEGEMISLLPAYADVIDMSVDQMHLDSYAVTDGMQRAEVSADLLLICERGGRASRRRERISLSLIKNAGCVTQAVCAPSFLKCPSCGAPMSLSEGKRCQYCGSEKKLSDYDWAIAGLRSQTVR